MTTPSGTEIEWCPYWEQQGHHWVPRQGVMTCDCKSEYRNGRVIEPQEVKDRKLKVYGWTGFRSADGFYGQTREIVAAHSQAEVMRLTGLTRSQWKHSGTETGNKEEVALALANPRTVFWTPLNKKLQGSTDWKKA